MSGMEKLMEQAQALQEKMRQAQEDLVSTEVEGVAGGGLVKVVLNGRHDVQSLFISPSLFKKVADSEGGEGEGGEGEGGASDKAKTFLEDLIAAAFNDAVQKIEAKAKDTMNGLAQGMDLPPEFKLPNQ